MFPNIICGIRFDHQGAASSGLGGNPSGSYPMLIDNRVVPRILSVLLGQSAAQQSIRRSCLAENGAQLAPSTVD